MPVDFLTTEQTESYGRFTGEPDELQRHCWKALNDISGMAMLSLRWNILIIALCIAMTLNSAILA